MGKQGKGEKKKWEIPISGKRRNRDKQPLQGSRESPHGKCLFSLRTSKVPSARGGPVLVEAGFDQGWVFQALPASN